MISGLVGAVGLGAIVPGLAFAATGVQSSAFVGSVSGGSGTVRALTGAASECQAGAVLCGISSPLTGVTLSPSVGSLLPTGGGESTPSVMLAYEIPAESLRYSIPVDGMTIAISPDNLTYRIEV